MRNTEKYKDNIENNINVCGLYQEIYKIKNGEYARDCCDNCDVMNLPYFTRNTMYKGMTVGRQYKLKELGL